MIRINLLPAEAAEKEAKKKFIILGVFVAGVIISIMVVFFFIRVAVSRTLASRISATQQELNEYQVIVNEVDKLKQITGTLESRKRIIESLMKGRLTYPRFMEDFLKQLPPTVWLTALQTAMEPDGLRVSMACYSFDNYGIADFISNLESSKDFITIELGGVNTSASGAIETLSFQLTCKYITKEL